jgi:predicted N-acetyltransferase YhbS
MTIQKATATDNKILTEITKKSKAFWGYSEEQIEQWSESLTITKDYIETQSVYKLNVEDTTVGYYSYFSEEENIIKLDNLFVLPEYIGKGFGRLLMNDFLSRLQNTAATKVILDSEPNAECFYSKFGFEKVGQLETSIKDRYLPVMTLNINIE